MHRTFNSSRFQLRRVWAWEACSDGRANRDAVRAVVLTRLGNLRRRVEQGVPRDVLVVKSVGGV